MDEEKGNEGAEEATPDTGNGLSVVERAEKAAEALKAENDRLESLKATNLIGGKSEIVKEEAPKEISNVDYAKAALSGKILTN